MSAQFRKCVGPLLEQQQNTTSSSLSSNSQCVVSSCLIQAGVGICDQADVAAAIDSNLGCVFKQVSFSFLSNYCLTIRNRI